MTENQVKPLIILINWTRTKSNKRPFSHLMLSLETPFPIQLKGTNNLYVKLASLVRKVEYLKLKKYMS
jgi:hypothetical protein